MKNKLYWFDDNRDWYVRPTRVLYELLLSPTDRKQVDGCDQEDATKIY